jgi:hypothetical protein
MLCRCFGGRWTNEITEDHHVVLDYAFPGEDNVSRAQDACAAGDFVACLLRGVSDDRPYQRCNGCSVQSRCTRP